MVSDKLEAEVTLDVDDDPVDDAIEAVNELEAALSNLESRGISVEVSGPASDKHGQVVRIDYDVAGKIGDLAAEAVAEMRGVDPERVKVFEISAPNRVRFEIIDEDEVAPSPDDESTDRASTERDVRRGLTRALRAFGVR